MGAASVRSDTPQFGARFHLFGCALALLGLSIASSTVPAGATDELERSPTEQRRLAFTDLAYKGAFRLPADDLETDKFAGGGQVIAFNPAASSLFVSGGKGNLGEVSIPSPVIAADAKDLPVAAILQRFVDPTEGRLDEVGPSANLLGGLLVYDGRLLGSAYVYYDALNEQRVSHFVRSPRLSDRSFRGWTQIGESEKTGFVSGWLALVPPEWRQLLGGDVVTGQCCLPIISRTSWGPAAFAVDAESIGRRVATATPLLYYTQDHPTLGAWDGSNERFGNSTEVGGLVLVDGTRSALFFGRTGMGEPCYGNGTSDKKLAGTLGDDGAKWCYDPTNMYKGTHAFPYRYQIWAYDLSDFAAVKAGKRRPWDVVPYAIWPLEFPTAEPRTIMGGIGYDAARRTIYASQRYADRDADESRPVIHVFQVR
jgi:hypothetical protein